MARTLGLPDTDILRKPISELTEAEQGLMKLRDADVRHAFADFSPDFKKMLAFGLLQDAGVLGTRNDR